MSYFKDLTGKNFGKLLVISKTKSYESPSGQKKAMWLCKCDCGNEVEVTSNNLSSGHTRSCGCYNKERIRKSNLKDLTGQKFGRLTVIRRAENYIKIPGHPVTRWLCRCDCGNEKIIRGGNLTSKITLSCGCYNKELNRLPNGEAALNETFHGYKKGAERRNIIFELSKEQFLKLTKENCFYCGKEPSNIFKNNRNNGDYVYNGIDRLDNTKGYIESNIVPCCFQCNRAKHNMIISDFYEWIDRAYEYRHEK